MRYRVAWQIDIETDDGAVDAAKQAREIMQDPNSTATFFDVTNENGREVCIELDESEPEAVEQTAHGGGIAFRHTIYGWGDSSEEHF